MASYAYFEPLSFIEAFRAEITSQNFMIHNSWLIFIFRVTASSICLSWMPQIKKHFNWIKIVHLHCMAVAYVAVVWTAIKDVHIAVAATTTIFQIYQSIEMAQKIIIFIRFRNGYKSRLSYVCSLRRLTDIYIQVRILMVTLTLQLIIHSTIKQNLQWHFRRAVLVLTTVLTLYMMSTVSFSNRPPFPGRVPRKSVLIEIFR